MKKVIVMVGFAANNVDGHVSRSAALWLSDWEVRDSAPEQAAAALFQKLASTAHGETESLHCTLQLEAQHVGQFIEAIGGWFVSHQAERGAFHFADSGHRWPVPVQVWTVITGGKVGECWHLVWNEESPRTLRVMGPDGEHYVRYPK